MQGTSVVTAYFVMALVTTYMGTACVVTTYIGIACILMCDIVTQYMVIAYIVMAYIVTTYMVIAYIGMAYIVTAYLIVAYCGYASHTVKAYIRGQGRGWVHFPSQTSNHKPHAALCTKKSTQKTQANPTVCALPVSTSLQQFFSSEEFRCTN